MKKNFIVSISGAQNTGKSTIVKDLLVKYPDLFYVPKGSYRDVIKEKGLVINQEGSFESQLAIMDYLVNQLEEVQKIENKIVILDRSVLDCYVYSKYLFYNKKITLEQFLELENKYIFTCSSYLDQVILVSFNKNIDLVNDKLRDINLEYINIINYIFAEEAYNIPMESHKESVFVEELGMLDRNQRIRHIVENILRVPIQDIFGEVSKIYLREEI